MASNSTVDGALVKNVDIVHGSQLQVNGGAAATGFSIVDPTDATKKLIFDLSGLSTGQTDTFSPSPGGSEVTTDGVQTLTNKKLDDTTTTFIDTAAPTKVFRFEAGSITAGQTRVVTVPDSNGTMAYLAGSTFTTATLTAPTINAATLTGAIAGGTLTPAILTAIDSTFTVTDNGDPTRVAAFQCSGITAGQTRTMTVPDSSGTLAYLDGSTFTTATLTAPAINGTVTTTGLILNSAAAIALNATTDFDITAVVDMAIGAGNSLELSATASTLGLIAGADLTATAVTTVGITSGTGMTLTSTASDLNVVCKSFVMTSTTGGLRCPNMTETQRDNISGPAAGMLVYNTTTNKLNLRVAAGWEVIVSA